MAIRIVTTYPSEDREAMIALRTRSFKEHYDENAGIAAFKNNGEGVTTLMEKVELDAEQMRHRDNVSYKAVDDAGTLLGYIIYDISESEENARLLQISTSSTEKGVGTQLMEHFKKDARSYGFKKIVAKPLPVAKGFYLKRGFVQEMSEGDYVLDLRPGF